ncbi:MAG TPA: response regulator transcription factor [Granulicella sp.]|jgi:two-component system copper resistance phosphate regulon response regulator CusR|nr:response regulator transcription factor [Granulicella sp.]
MRVLVVEDDQRVARLLERSLTEDGHAVIVAHDGAEGLDLARGDSFDALVLDVMLPRMDGFSIVKTLRAERRATPVLMLTARDTMQDTVNGLNFGADDYLTKPFHIDVLLARVRAISRRGPVPQFTDLKAGELSLNRATHQVNCCARTILLTHKEYILLELLMRRAGHVVLRAQLIEAAWGFDPNISDNSLDVCVSSLRSKLCSEDNSRYIRTIRGSGYMMSPGE